MFSFINFFKYIGIYGILFHDLKNGIIIFLHFLLVLKVRSMNETKHVCI